MQFLIAFFTDKKGVLTENILLKTSHIDMRDICKRSVAVIMLGRGEFLFIIRQKITQSLEKCFTYTEKIQNVTIA